MWGVLQNDLRLQDGRILVLDITFKGTNRLHELPIVFLEKRYEILLEEIYVKNTFDQFLYEGLRRTFFQ
jgi:hypothetical protein